VPHQVGDAIEAMAEALLATPPQSAWLVATGAMTNVGHLLTRYRSIPAHIAGLSIMGGAIGSEFSNAPMGKVDDRERFGNYTAWAEFNILCDPEAAALIFTNPVLSVKTILIPLDVTHQVLATKEVQELLGGSKSSKPSTLRQMLLELLNFFANTYSEVFGITAGPPLHDPLAVAVILDGLKDIEVPFYDHKTGEEGRRERYHVEVLTEGSHEDALGGLTQTGRTIAKLLDEGEQGVKIPRSLDVQRFWQLLEECLSRADEVNAKRVSV
jgi:uridine nucleosidase